MEGPGSTPPYMVVVVSADSCRAICGYGTNAQTAVASLCGTIKGESNEPRRWRRNEDWEMCQAFGFRQGAHQGAPLDLSQFPNPLAERHPT